MIDNDLFVLALVIAAVLGVVLPWARRLKLWLDERRATRAARARRDAATGSREGLEALRVPAIAVVPVPVPVARGAAPGAALGAALSVPRRTSMRHRRRWPVGDLREARRGIVLITVFGPCRGLEPPDGTP